MSVSLPTGYEFENLFDRESDEAVRLAEADPEQAARALLIAARFIRSGRPLPKVLAEHIAGAIEAAMAKPEDKRLDELGFELFLKTHNKRPHALDSVAAYALIQKHFHLVQSTNQGYNFKTKELRQLLMQESGCSESHARRLLGKVQRQFDEESKEASTVGLNLKLKPD